MKTLFLSILTAATCVSAADFTTESGRYAGSVYCYGFVLSLDNEYLSTTNPSFAETGTSSVYLTEISIVGRDIGEPGVTADVKLAVFDSDGNFLTISNESASFNTQANQTWNLTFSPVELSVSESYTYLFVSADATAESLFDTKATQVEAYRTGISASSGSSANVLLSGSDFQKTKVFDPLTPSDMEGYMPNVVIKTTDTLPVPEPTTATLSLLSLAGLCARRRRR